MSENDRPARPAPAKKPSTRKPVHDLRVQHFGFLLLNNFSLIALGAAVDPLRIANQVVGQTVYRYVLLSVDGGPVVSSDGIQLSVNHALADKIHFDTIFVVGPNPIPTRGIGGILDWLRRQANAGVALGGLDTGSYFLARAGLLNGHRCTIHWEDRDVILEYFPQLVLSNRIYEIDRQRYTCSGGIAPIDLMSRLISQPPGSEELAARVLELLLADRRGHDQQQRMSLRHYRGAEHTRLEEALHLMESNVEETLAVEEIANYLRVSSRQLERWFKARMGKTPVQAYQEIRLLRARQLLYRTGQSLSEICNNTGFASTTSFSNAYKRQFGISPIADRRRYHNAA
ncbi:GlxA family transcriptional regulator [Pandoraea sp.]|uniref:GlxA family transcriptional regulator n=1 Tax=Pandoraea sp. TaxID=1883445 RepID=UPI00120A0B11|nr:GlxA family transcriptional regulator [Pandoraea sp.]TAL55064.1 MAG: GlxA family transcriptional regulator [Pandoraea sp.]TAM19888.1 MAG: GlxA family transcriptional regulator [Pandoraea sp.]